MRTTVAPYACSLSKEEDDREEKRREGGQRVRDEEVGWVTWKKMRWAISG
jgi:hypothetical protein